MVRCNLPGTRQPRHNDVVNPLMGPTMTDEFRSEREYVALDLETTGLMAETDRIVEIGAVRFLGDGQEIGRFQRLVNPQRPMSPAAYAIHGLSDADLADAAPAHEILPAFLSFLGNPGTTALLAHNAAFDAGFLGRELGRAGILAPSHSLFDTLALARRRLPQLASHRLDNLARVLGLDSTDAHRALADSLRVKAIWLHLDGESEAENTLVSFRMFDPKDSGPTPDGCEPLVNAAARGIMVQIEYDGGTRGATPRSITPRRFVQRGGATYLVAFCHLDLFEKSFRLDRIRCVEITTEPAAEAVPVDHPAARG
jgi:DNA polymerase III subunit epsilon